MAATGLAAGVDVGGTKLAAGLVGGDGSVLTRLRRDTPARDAEAIVEVVAEVVEGLFAEHGRLPVGVGAAGLVDLDGAIAYAPNIRWTGFPLRAELERRLDVPVCVDNDANTAAYGEYRAGAGLHAGNSMVMLTVGTGVGGGLVVGDRLLRGAHGFAAELGHIIVDEGGAPCPCGNRGCLEALASGNAIGRAAREGLKSGRAPADTELAGLPVDEVDGKRVTIAAHAGDPYALAVLAEAGTWLGVGVASLVNAVDPELVVVGGGAIQAGELLLEPARAAAQERLMGNGHRPLPPLVRAGLGDDAGLVGAALLAIEAAAG